MSVSVKGPGRLGNAATRRMLQARTYHSFLLFSLLPFNSRSLLVVHLLDFCVVELYLGLVLGNLFLRGQNGSEGQASYQQVASSRVNSGRALAESYFDFRDLAPYLHHLHVVLVHNGRDHVLQALP